MKISIITPTNNSEKYIACNIATVLNQTFDDFEQIIVDNESSDNTLEVASELYSKAGKNKSLKIICEPDNGISDAFNKGINRAEGDIITFLNSDDEYMQNDVLSTVESVFRDEKIFFSHGNIFFYDPIRGSVTKTPLGTSLTDGMIFYHPSMFFKKELFKKYGIFDTKYRYAMDFELLCRFLSKDPGFLLKGKYLDKTLTKMNFGGKSWGNPIETLKETKKILKSYNMWNLRARRKFLLNKAKTFLIISMVKYKLGFFLIILRKFKWNYFNRHNLYSNVRIK